MSNVPQTYQAGVNAAQTGKPHNTSNWAYPVQQAYYANGGK